MAFSIRILSAVFWGFFWKRLVLSTIDSQPHCSLHVYIEHFLTPFRRSLSLKRECHWIFTRMSTEPTLNVIQKVRTF